MHDSNEMLLFLSASTWLLEGLSTIRTADSVMDLERFCFEMINWLIFK